MYVTCHVKKKFTEKNEIFIRKWRFALCHVTIYLTLAHFAVSCGYTPDFSSFRYVISSIDEMYFAKYCRPDHMT